MNILIVGGAGYIGSHMVRFLRERTDHEVIVLDDMTRGHAAAIEGTFFVVGDYGDAELIANLCHARKVDAIMHFGADSQVGESMANPAKYYTNNVVKGKALADGAIAAGVRAMIFSSSAAVYGEPSHTPITEDMPQRPTNPYGRTKLTFEGLLESYREAYGMVYTALRYFNAAGAHPSGEIGEDHTPESHIIPVVLGVAMGQTASVTIHGQDYPTPDGSCVRDYIHVDDLADAHLRALERLMSGGSSGAYNLGNGTGFSVQQVLDVCRAVTGHAIPAMIGPRRPGDPATLVASAARAHADLGWLPQHQDLADIVETAWRWHQGHPTGYGA
jgi:UDP-glucose 4-epimerase